MVARPPLGRLSGWELLRDRLAVLHVLPKGRARPPSPGVISLRVASPSPNPTGAGSLAQTPVRSEFALTAEFEDIAIDEGAGTA